MRLGPQVEVGAPERNDARVGRRAGGHREPVRAHAGAEDGEAGPRLAVGVHQPDPARPGLDPLDAAVHDDRHLAALELARQRPRHLGEVDDAGVRRVQRRHAAAVRLDLAQLRRRQPPQPGHLVLAPAPLELVQAPQLAVVARDDQLAAALVGIPSRSQNSYISRAPSTHSRAFSEPGR